ncbi:MAG TPA: LamG domain-containing protein [Kofleriaceae bacterium]|jgi:hypothetical protein
MRAVWLVVLAACRVPAVDLAGKSCPCPAPYTCDLASNTCGIGDAAGPGDAADARGDSSDAPADARPSYRDVVLSDHPIGYWRLGDTASVAMDETGTYDGAYSGACTERVPGAIVGDPDTAVVFDGSTCKITLPVAFPFSGTAPYSIEAWSSTTANTLYQMIFCGEQRDALDPLDGYALLVTPSSATGGFQLERVVSSSSVKTPIDPAAGGFHHVVATYDGAHVALYVDGALIGETADARSAAAITQVAIIGKSSAGNPYTGALDEVALYPTALPASRIAAHYAAGTGL